MQYQVENLEDQFFIPALIIFHHLNKKFLDPNQLMQILGPDGQKIQLDPIDVLNADVQFSMKASSKMRSKQALQAGGLQFLFQSYMNPEMMQIMAQMGIMPNFEEFDASSFRHDGSSTEVSGNPHASGLVAADAAKLPTGAGDRGAAEDAGRQAGSARPASGRSQRYQAAHCSHAEALRESTTSGQDDGNEKRPRGEGSSSEGKASLTSTARFRREVA
jgi:hypothetical protein